MLNGELLRVAWRAISAHKLRSFLTLLGVIIGVMTVVAVVSVIQGLNNYVATKLFTLSPDVYTIERFGIITSRDEFLEALKRKRIQKSDFEAFQRLSKTAVMVGARSGTSRSVRSGSKRLSDVQISGVTANVAELSNLDVDLGRFFTEPENERRAFVAVIGTEVRDELFPRLDPVGRTISIDGIPFRVIGLLVKQGSAFGQSQDNVVYVPREALAKAWGARRGLSIYVKAKGRRRGDPGLDGRGARHLPGPPQDRAVGPRPGLLRHGRGDPGRLAVDLGRRLRPPRLHQQHLARRRGDRHREHHARLGRRDGRRRSASASRSERGRRTSAGSSSSRRRSSPSAAAPSASSSAGSSRRSSTPSRPSRRSSLRA